jgi:hypothetical protein
MKRLLVAAFTVFICTIANGQQAEISKESLPDQTYEVTSSSSIPPEPLYVISEGGIKREASKEDLEKLNITQIESVEMLLDNELLEEYGEKGRNGVMIICLRKD